MMSGKIVLKTTDSTHLHSLCPIKNKNYKYMPCKTSWISGHPKVKPYPKSRKIRQKFLALEATSYNGCYN